MRSQILTDNTTLTDASIVFQSIGKNDTLKLTDERFYNWLSNVSSSSKIILSVLCFNIMKFLSTFLVTRL